MAVRDLIPRARSRDFIPDFWREERLSPFFTLHREMNRVMDDLVRSFSTSFGPARTDFVSAAWPKVEVAETDKDVTVYAEMPGMEEKDVELVLKDGHLIIHGEAKCETEEKARQWTERFYGRFERQIPVGFDIDEDKVEAAFKNGVLTVICPKSEKAVAAKRIAINIPTKH